MSSILSIALTIFLIIDALGIIPTYVDLVKKVDRRKKRTIAIREMLIALLIMLSFNFLGEWLLTLLSITSHTVQIAGGMIIFLIAIRLIFPKEEEDPNLWGETEPFIFPIATPLFAGPSVLAAIMIYAQEEPSHWVMLTAIFVAWLSSSIILFFAFPIFRIIGEKGLLACQRLMGLIVGLIAVQMFLQGIEDLFLQKI
jgi:multiple antibiotic resistance protein